MLFEERVRGEAMRGLGAIEAIGMETDTTVREIEEGRCNLADSGSSLQSECGGQKDFLQIFYAKETGRCTLFLPICL